jgi:alkylresorcinol/alkylpyrone synthase
VVNGLATVRGIAAAVPAALDHAGLWDGFFRVHYRDNPTAEKVWASAGITTRHMTVDPRTEDISGWGTGARMRRFVEEALPLGKEAVAGALGTAGLDPDDVGLFAVVSCTGYATPGLDILLARDLGMPRDVQRLHVGHMGCYAALPGLRAVADHVAVRGCAAVLLCEELTSLHIQPARDDVEQMVAHALFADAAVAVAVAPTGGWRLVDVTACTDTTGVSAMTWDVTDLGFRLGLSPRVPDALAGHVRPAVETLLGRHGLSVADVAGWAIHPGGRRIVEVVGERLGLDEAALAPSYAVLDGYGNCSSATVLLVLQRLLDAGPLPPGAPVVAMAFGPGLTLYAALLQAG